MARRRNKRGTYSKRRKMFYRDRYGHAENGECIDYIAGTMVRYKLPAHGLVRVKNGSILKEDFSE